MGSNGDLYDQTLVAPEWQGCDLLWRISDRLWRILLLSTEKYLLALADNSILKPLC